VKPRAFLTAWLAAALAAGGTGVHAQSGAGAHAVQAPHWGDALFHVYQGHTFTALTTLMASQHFDRLPPHGDEAEAVRGGLLLAYGLHGPAEAIFSALADRGTTPAVRDRAWFYLARIRWQRGLAAEAEAALARIGAPLATGLEEERALLAAQLRLAAGDFDGAAARLDGLAAAGPTASPYARYNLGVALLRGGQTEAGRTWLQGLAAQRADTEEQRSLRDRARLALGFAALQARQPQDARAQLESVRLAGPYSNQALLGFGWAAAALKAPRDALVPWQELLARDPSDPAVLEARLAVPYALAELKAFGQAHDGYLQAIAAYDREARALDDTIAAVRSGTLVEALLARNPGEDLGWLWQAAELPELPHPAHLLPLLATHGFQEALKDQRDLRFLLANLRRWADDLRIFGDMLATRRQAYAERLPAVQQAQRETSLERLRAQRAEQAAALAEAEAQGDGVALADAAERALLERLARVQAALDKLPADQAAPARERSRRVAGALGWRLAHQQPERLWAAKKALRAIDAELEAAAAREAALARAQRDEPARFERFDDRIAALAQRIAALLPRVAALQAEQQQALHALAVEALQAQQARLAEYGTQARFALAQLQDRATLARNDDDATAR